MSARQETPLGIQIICALGVLDAGLTLLKALFSIGLSVFVGLPVGGIGSAVAIVFALGQLVTIWGLWNLQSWAWTAAVLVFLGDLLTDVVGLLLGRGGFVSLALGVVVLAYLLSQRDRYQRRSRGY